LLSTLAFFIHKSKIKATNARIQITRLLVKLECLEIILFNAFAFFKDVKRDDFKALKFYQKACDLNDGSGCFLLGFMYEIECLEIILFNAPAFFIQKSKIKATIAIILQSTQVLPKGV
jgi:hypothetical protein